MNTATLPEAPPETLVKDTAPAEATQAVTHIRPSGGWQLLNVRELWRFRELIYFLAWRDVKVRYKQTVLGAAWAVLQPALLMIVFTLLFNRIAGLGSGDLPYPLFVYAGLVPWTFFSSSVANAGNSVVGSERLVTKIYFPRLAIPFASVGAAVVDFLCAMGLLVCMMVYYMLTRPDSGIVLGWGLMVLPLVFLATLLAAAGMGSLLSALNVKYRDFRYVIPFLMQVWMFATPSIFVANTSHDGWKALLVLNPMNNLVAAFRAAVLGGDIAWGGLAIGAGFAVALFLVGSLYFRKVEDDFADII
jgi:lipopolysaccharide transport system permease protein